MDETKKTKKNLGKNLPFQFNRKSGLFPSFVDEEFEDFDISELREELANNV